MNITPQEIEVWYVLPALRKEIASCLKFKGLKQKEIATYLGITEAAISQYFKSKRATSVNFDENIKTEILNSTNEIYNNPNVLQEELQRLLGIVKSSKSLCDTHKKFDNISFECDICMKHNK